MLFLITTPVTDGRLLTGSCTRKVQRAPVFFLATVKAQWEQGGGRILLGVDTGGGAVTLWPIRFRCAGVWISSRLKGRSHLQAGALRKDTCCV